MLALATAIVASGRPIAWSRLDQLERHFHAFTESIDGGF